jgi:hypothetical protein
MRFWNVELYLTSNAVQRLVDALKTYEALGRDYWSSFRTILVSGLPKLPGLERQGALQYLLGRTRALKAAELISAPPYVMQTLALSCTESLRSLKMYTMRDVPYAGLFRGLRRLDIILEASLDIYEQLKDAAAWCLPQLESLQWVEVRRPWGCDHNRAVRFLSECRFPQLRQAHLDIDVGEVHFDDVDVDDGQSEWDIAIEGPQLLCRFLTAHPAIDDLSFTMSPDAYSLVLPAVRSHRLGLHACSKLSTSLFTLLPPSVTILKLPVYLTEEEDDVEDIDVPIQDMLFTLLAIKTNVKEVHLSIGRMWDSPCYDDDHLAELPLHFAREAENINVRLLKELGVIFQVAVKLQEHGITVHDERGMMFQDYFSGGSARLHD